MLILSLVMKKKKAEQKIGLEKNDIDWKKRGRSDKERQFERLFNIEVIIDIDSIIDNKRSRYNFANFLLYMF